MGISDLRKQLIEEEIEEFVAKAVEELENPMRPEGVESVKTAAMKLAYTDKFYDTEKDEIMLIPSLPNLMIGSELFEEAEKTYFEPGDDYPLKYIAAFKTVAYAQGAVVPDDYEAEKMEKMKEPIGDDDTALFEKALKGKHKKARLSMMNPFASDFDEILETVDKEHEGGFVNREAYEALRLAAITVGGEFSTLVLCLMDDKIYDEAKEFLDADEFPADVKDAFKSVAMAKLAAN